MTELRATEIHGYGDRASVGPGETIEFKVSSTAAGTYRADIVRLVNGDTNPAGPGFTEVEVDGVSGEYPARFQPTDAGSYILVDDGGPLATEGALTLHAFIYPTTPQKHDQIVLGRYVKGTNAGYALSINDGRLSFLIGDGDSTTVFEADQLFHPSCWYSVAVTLDPAAQRYTLYSRPVVNSVNSLLAPISPIIGGGDSTGVVDILPADSAGPFIIGGGRTSSHDEAVDSHFNGKVDSPKVWSRALSVVELDSITRGERPTSDGLLAWWDFAAAIGSDGISTDAVHDNGPLALHGQCVNFPTRAVTGWRWEGREENFIHAPEQYGAIHFHDDDLEDCRWDTDISWEIPPGFRTGIYALRLLQGESEDWVPFFVLPPAGKATARVLMLVPTTSYLAYANEHFNDVQIAQSIFGRTSVIDELDFWLHSHTEFGRSTYDTHTDGSGVHYSSWLRPIVNLRPKFRTVTGGPWQFPADLHLAAWLESLGIEYDIATDRELHDEGDELLSRYKVVLTGSHPEYYTRQMLDAWETYLAGGGRGMYLGANGFYWIANWHPEKKHLMEVRKAEWGSRAWQAAPGEYYLQTNGERSGLWRGRARAPQKLFGTGFTSEGFDESSYYVQMPDTRDPQAAFIMEGIDPGEKIGDFGLVGGGAAGSEIDRYDLSLGTPPHTFLLAYSEGHSDNYPRVVDDIMFNYPMVGGTMDPNVRADITYFTTSQGGGMFSTSSIAWCGSLLENDAINNVSRMTENVLRRFMADEPLPPLHQPQVVTPPVPASP
ncbi:LamG domain-containing protein [Rhodococcus sp. USK13]|uniref:LamG domain-containing protein n=1 Tax=Rhodococcus sp. USK13 TaxID=2806442 RepID=UPI001BCCD346|nr:LamG domain-containing protein [Rhodococcus sp. USK13]